MAKQLLSYWKRETADANLERGGLLDHAASNQYGRLGVGDSVWIVTVRDGELYLLGRILVDKVTDQGGASTALRTRNLWDADYHILAERQSALPIQEIPIGHLASRLRFQSRSGNTRLTVSKCRVNPQQLQTMRLLTTDAATLLESALGGGRVSSGVKRVSGGEVSSQPDIVRDADTETDERGPVLLALRRLQSAGRKSMDLVKPEYRDLDRSEVDLNGLCYVLSECLYHLYSSLLTPYRISWGDGTTHWFLRFHDGQILDAIDENGEECCDQFDYERARRVAFLTKKPSKRALKLFARAGIEEPIQGT